MIEFLKDEEKRGILFLVTSGISLIASFFSGKYLPLDPAWIAIVLCGIPIVRGAAVALATEFDVKADLLVSLALIASVIIGETFAAGEVAFIMTLGAMLEERTVAKARAGIERLVHLTPRTARIVHEGEERVISAEQVKVGDMLRVLAGETIAVDGIIVTGQTSINQSVMTGESLPVDKGAGDEVASGTVNQFGTFDMRASKVGEDSSLQRMIRLVESADAGKAKIVGLADRWATWIVVIALVSAAVTWFVTGEIIRAVTILVVFCPCALVLATPTAIMAGIGNAAKYGILIREGDALERLAAVSRLAFDKTGTLTYGTPHVVAADSFDSGMSGEEIFSLAASAERLSEHPLGKAITAHYKETAGSLPREPQKFSLIAGRGVEAQVEDKSILAGNPELLAEQMIRLPDSMMEKAETYKNDGCTVIFIAVNGIASGMIALADELRGDAAQVVRKVGESGIGTILLTGDNERAARHIADETGISEVYADCLPETKLKIIDRCQRDGKLICMVGDGVNDAPALKKAHVGIAMGGIGSDIAIDAADIALVGDDIKNLPHLLKLSRKTMGKITVNLTASMVLNFAAIILAMTGILNPVVGALVHNVGSVVVIINSSLLLKWKEK
ncbi:heavy metal translocating P-type ATPase [Breznakiella homolactica]|uniref:P-type Zn(2+) transporter n=1 Tax=Breznakiella homolactica TaxID=2798577 RepID=A0A7T8B8V2_9SPIR|nr:cation-translocating P-type ATPase [Breznakiella homolactica]QQO07772.1 cation-translocating P-type ATPase [Breznakiella homolactica]